MARTETVALALATQHAIEAGMREPWTWARDNAEEFAEAAAVPWTQQEFEEECAETVAELEALGELAGIFVGPPPSIDAGPEAHAAYAEALLDALDGR